ncbi:MAG: aminofutalosine synthase MqnE [bacterium]
MLARFQEDRIYKAGLGSIYKKTLEAQRLTAEEGVILYESRDPLSVGAMANIIRERKNGNFAWFNQNMRIDYTNICDKRCEFCAFSRASGDTGAYTLSPEEIESFASQPEHDGVTEAHIVGGVNPGLPFDYYLELLRAVKRARPAIHLKAFTMVEIDQIINLSPLSPPETMDALIDAGLDSCPGGGAEILCERIHRTLCRRKIPPERWLELQRMVHRRGLRTTATMLYGHIETAAERVEHMIKLRQLQDETGGFLAFVPLAFHPLNTRLSHISFPTALDDLMNIAVARLMLDNFNHIKAYWIMLTPSVSQISLSYGADDMDGTIMRETIAHEAGARTPPMLSVERLVALIRETGRTPAERDSIYNPVRVYNA